VSARGGGSGGAAAAVQADVLVLGGGMAGSIAALAARASGARVALVSRAPGATALSSGAVGVAPDSWAAWNEPFASRLSTLAAARRIAASRPGHPYARVGAELDRLEEALAFAAAELEEVLCPPGARPLFLATPSGGVRSCGLAQRSMVAGDLASIRGPLAVVGLRGHLGFDAALVAGALSTCPALAVRGGHRAVEIDLFMDEESAVLRPHELARALEVEGAAEEAGRRLRLALPPCAAAALLPPVLGLSPGARVAELIAEGAGLPVAEALGDVPSVPGLRLDAALRRRLAAAGVEVLEGSAAAAGPGSTVSVGRREVHAPAWVLATGRFTSGGIVRRGKLEEALLDLPVAVAGRGGAGADLSARPSASLTARDRRAPQALFTAGVAVDGELRPLGEGGAPAHPRLFAAGAVVSGHDVADGTGLGVAILTGYLAGRNAAAGG
jgi:glycerol-3-phosphate dehydrogenase subunit B